MFFFSPQDEEIQYNFCLFAVFLHHLLWILAKIIFPNSKQMASVQIIFFFVAIYTIALYSARLASPCAGI